MSAWLVKTGYAIGQPPMQSCTKALAMPSVATDPAMQSDPAMRRCTARAIPGQVSMYDRGHQGNRRQRPCDDVRPGPSPAKRQYMVSTVQRKTASALKRDLPMGESTIMVEAMAVESIAMAVEDDGGDGRWR